MHLKQLKLAGFKSFVDPTVVHFPSQLVAVVGPNGCGKSNIIDAVRWVMGESSARNLRGESMTDVIFNGSSHRKPVGQASVELVFDNSLGRLTGPFASYGEIAVKRVVTRDGDSNYYLNGARCRRKDITDIFLGTGAGARGYSIIGQGTISQLIEAKPDDLRVFLEEAAGVSKYKERRRETLQRIAHTRENLARVADIREELDKQLQRLDRQAKAAERYLILKEEEQLCRAEILALKWKDYISQQEIKQRELQELAICHEQQQSILIKANKDRVLVNEKLHDAEEQTQQIQVSFYQVATDIARLEESMQQQVREKKRLEQEQRQMQEDWQRAERQIRLDNEELVLCQQQERCLAQQLERLKLEFGEQEVRWQQTQRQQEQWDTHWQEVQAQTSRLKREFQIAEINVQHLAQKQHATRLRMDKLQLEHASISVDELHKARDELQQQQTELVESQQSDACALRQGQENTNNLRLKVQDAEQQLHHLQDDFHHSNSEYAALMAAQKAARQGVGVNRKGIDAWSEKSRLIDILQVEEQWQFACEQVLDETLHAYVLQSMDELWPWREHRERQGESIVVLHKRPDTAAPHPLLIDKIHGDIPAHCSPLTSIYAAEHIDEAISWLPELDEYHSVITPDGFWLGRGWVKCVYSSEQDEPGLLARQQKIADVAVIVNELQQRIESIKITRDQYHQQWQKSVYENQLQQSNLNASNEALRANLSALNSRGQAILQAEQRVAVLVEEREELQLVLEETVAEHLLVKDSLFVLENQLREYEQQQEQCLHEKQERQAVLAQQHQQIDEARQALHRTELEYEREKNKARLLDERIQREQERLDILQERLEQVALLCLQAEHPDALLKEQLAQCLQRHGDIELQLTQSREHVSLLRMELEDFEKHILNSDMGVKQVQELISQARMQEQALSVRAASLQESLDESGVQAEVLLKHIPEGTTQSGREDDLISLADKIKRLGAINLAAIEEFVSERQRKHYLDEQYDDLSQALTTLETAIEKMDKETRMRLEHTFMEVNASFKSLFPRLFGGGRAQLELTCDNLLEAGILVMAQPPGKRNSTIHLLSGGEKAMTAVALVFAIFQLNPSPFCMLDEVDAPLDDVNVTRFCALVKEMSQSVQFLFITHNKVTMELADHLMGVTMREPGVSRLVAVDVTQALAME